MHGNVFRPALECLFAEFFRNLTGQNFQGKEYADYIRHIAIGSMGFTPGSIEHCRDGGVIDTGKIPNV